MSLFQESIIRKHLGYLDQEVVDQAYLRYKEVYSASKITNIKVAKEEQYQEGFIKDIFGAVLGYSVFPEQPFNIQTEKKNEANSKKADGAIFQGENVVGVIELKDNKTKNLDAVKDQAFGYKNNHKDCSYVISSNFHKLRFYLDDATDYEEFDLYNLDKETFKRFYLYLRKEGLLDKNIPKLLRQETKFHEENITKSLYKDYSSFKNSFFQNVVKNNPQYDKLLLFKKSQKFLDKVLFVLFAEDKGLVSTNSIVQIVEKWNDLKNDAFDTPKPLYHLVALFFNNLFIGKKDQKGGMLIPEFGGEIFAPDEILDTLIVDDEVLQDNLLKLSKYDFNTDVDVNILGHIFEHSLSEIEEVEAELKGEVADKTKGKRKKDGVFYTPKYITKYIVENTVGKLCSEKKTELKLDSDITIFELQKADGKLNAKGIELFTTLNQYKYWLLTLKILDPACGSGAFLNQAVNFLVKEHQYIDDVIAELTNSPLRLFDIDIAILENNIYGVDINEESVEIAKLSLWLRTAQQGRKLSNLSNNIKCGNSLIDDPAVAGDKAFNWQNEFPEVFAKGGFDVVIGNPPYVRQELFKHIKPYLEKNYKCYNSVSDLYTYFIELGIRLINNNGKFSFILPNKFLKSTYGTEIRRVMKNDSFLETLLDFDDYPVFDDATTYPIIFILNKAKTREKDFFYYSEINNRVKTDNPIELLETKKIKVPYISLTDEMWNFIKQDSLILINKLKDNAMVLNSLVNKKIYRGLTTGKNEAFVIDEAKKEELISKNIKNAELIKVLATGKEVKRNAFNFLNKYLLFTGFDNDIPSNYPDIQEELDKFKQDLIKRSDQGLNYWNLRSCAYYPEMQMPKIIYPRINNQGNFYFDAKGEVFLLDNNFFIASDSIGLLGLLNSKLVFYYLTNVCTTLQGGFYDFRRDKISTIPIHNNFNSYEAKIGKISQDLIQLVQDLELTNSKFYRSLERKFALTELPKKLQDWYLLSYVEFIKELGKKKIKLSLSEEAEWEIYFTTEAQKATELKTQIAKTDKEIDQMVYQLYDLTEEEISIIENSTK